MLTAWIDRGPYGLFIKDPIRRGSISKNRVFTNKKSGYARRAERYVEQHFCQRALRNSIHALADPPCGEVRGGHVLRRRVLRAGRREHFASMTLERKVLVVIDLLFDLLHPRFLRELVRRISVQVDRFVGLRGACVLAPPQPMQYSCFTSGIT